MGGVYDITHIRNDKAICQLSKPNFIPPNVLGNIVCGYFGYNQRTEEEYTDPYPFWMGLISNIGISAVLPSYTMANHPGWVEWTDYIFSDSVVTDQRQNLGMTSSNIIGHSYYGNIATFAGLLPQFTITSSGSIWGCFISSDGAKGGTTGLLVSQAPFASPFFVESGDTLTVQYTVWGQN